MRDRTSRIALSSPHLEQLWQRYQRVRAASERLCEPLEAEDYVIQSMADVSPPKWHLAHVTWFFEAFVLQPFLPGYHRWMSATTICSIPTTRPTARPSSGRGAGCCRGRR